MRLLLASLLLVTSCGYGARSGAEREPAPGPGSASASTSASASASGSGQGSGSAPAPAPRYGELSVVARFPYVGGSELSFDGRYVFAGQFDGRTGRGQTPGQGGVRIVDTTGAKPRVVGHIRCGGHDHDVAVIRPGLLALGYHRSRCGGLRADGVTLYDVSDPARPVRLGSLAVPRSHTITAVPGTSYLYVSPGGTRREYRDQTIVDVSDPRRPRIAASVTVDPTGCHDVSFFRTPGRLLGICTGGGGTVLWDATDPVRPTVLGRIDNPDIQFPHAAEVSPDGALLVINDEAYRRHECGVPTNRTGALTIYDIEDVTRPRRLGFFAPPRGRVAVGDGRAGVGSWCTSHQFNFLPDSRRLAVAWFTGGASVLDLSNPAAPYEVASYQPAGALVWTAHWFADRLWVNDMARGLDVLTMRPSTRAPTPSRPPS